MTTREKAHALLDQLPESEIEPVVEFIVSRRNADVDLGELLDEEGDELLGELDKKERVVDEWGDLDKFSARASLGVLRHMTEEEEKAGFSWEQYR